MPPNSAATSLSSSNPSGTLKSSYFSGAPCGAPFSLRRDFGAALASLAVSLPSAFVSGFVSFDGVVLEGVAGGRTIVSAGLLSGVEGGVDVGLKSAIVPVGVLVTPASSNVICCGSGIGFPHHLQVIVGAIGHDVGE